MVRNVNHRILWQILVWGGAWLLISFILTNGLDQPERFIRRGFSSLIGIAIIVIVNLKFLLPQLYFKKKLPTFILSGIILLIGVVLLLYSEVLPWADWFNPLRERPFATLRENIPDRKGRNLIFGVQWMRHMVPFFIAFLGSTLIEIARFASRKEKEAIRFEKDKLEAEVKFLKSQINPHFLFNALNNIYALTVIKSDKAPENLHRLSGMLRYMLYDSNEGKVPLKKEIDYLQNYINLALLKDSRGLDITVDLDESRPDLLVAPLLFIPFVENAFKHSKIEDLENGMIKIGLATYDNQLEFMVENSVPQNGFTKDKVGGIGLVNIKQRLELLYPDKHVLNINQNENLFKVFLKLDLK